MLEVKVNVVVTAPEVAGAISNLATAISGKASQTQSVSDTQTNTEMSTVSVQATSAQPQPIAVPRVPVQQPVTPVASVPVAEAPQYTIDQIMAAGAALMDAGKINDLRNLLQSFGVQSVMELKPEQLGAFATEMRKLGGAI